MNINTPEGMARAVAEQQAMISGLAQGGRWIVPRSSSIYMIDHHGKRAMCVLGERQFKIDRVFAAMGWTVVPEDAPHTTLPIAPRRTLESGPANGNEQLKLF